MSRITDLALHSHPAIDTIFGLKSDTEQSSENSDSGMLIFTSNLPIQPLTDFIRQSCSSYDIVIYISDGRKDIKSLVEFENLVILCDNYYLNKHSRLMIYGGRSNAKLLETMIFAGKHKCELLFYMLPIL